ncbi:MBL fold metallo-hydrolase [Demequina sp. B12]|uniref:MBL fold metallo-hydrolase n=1 Tax=Demequina sp. B12 TaxID=2992757 RepID=UPI00237C008D|nr:MBL fold metallo-hydrolase [Demequina sp. B12]MDE0572323.1 MBL fold metallo-hydrolase [Demequina sp. B12]
MTHIITATLIGGPTAVLQYAGLTIVTDPTFDQPGPHAYLVKTHGPALTADQVGVADVVLISHDQHPDNLDDAGREYAQRSTVAITTVAGAERNPGFVGVAPGDTHTVQGDVEVTITAVPAQHGPFELVEVAGPVVGFVMEAEGWPTVYFSGDNASVEVAGTIADRFPYVDVALLCVGAAQLAMRGPALLTLNADRAAQVMQRWPSATVVPVHADGWEHFSEQRAQAVARLRELGLAGRLVDLEPGVPTVV